MLPCALHTHTHTHTHINAMGSQWALLLYSYFRNCPPTYKHKSASVILFISCSTFAFKFVFLLEPLLFSKSSCALLCTHVHTYRQLGLCFVISRLNYYLISLLSLVAMCTFRCEPALQECTHAHWHACTNTHTHTNILKNTHIHK